MKIASTDASAACANALWNAASIACLRSRDRAGENSAKALSRWTSAMSAILIVLCWRPRRENQSRRDRLLPTRSFVEFLLRRPTLATLWGLEPKEPEDLLLAEQRARVNRHVVHQQVEELLLLSKNPVDPLLNRVLTDVAINRHRILLAEAMGAILCLALNGRIPP